MKVLSLISTALLTLSLAGAVQAQPAAPAATDVAPATIVLAHCDASDTAKCNIDPPEARQGALDASAVAAAEARHQAPNDPAMPVPEPQTFIMLMLGLVALGIATRRGKSPDKFLKD